MIFRVNYSRFRGGGATAKYGQLEDDEGGTADYQETAHQGGYAGGAPGAGQPVHSVDHVELDHGPQDWRK